MYCDELLFRKIKDGEMSSAESTKFTLLALDILKEKEKCLVCNGEMTLQLDKSKSAMVRYWCGFCKKRHEVRKFTAFKQLRLKILEVVQIILLFSINTPVIEISKKMLLSTTSVQKVIKLARKSIFEHIEATQPVLGGETVVEIDETVVARRKYNRGRMVEQRWLFGAIERGNGNLLLKCVEKRDSATLGRVIREFITQGSTVYSDKWAAYLSFFSSGHNFNHQSVNHSENFVDPDNNEIHTQTIEGLWSRLKHFLRSRRYSRREYIEEYLAEFIFRRKHQNLNDREVFMKIFGLVKKI
jgi:IS1 family transposase/transposase-like protein